MKDIGGHTCMYFIYVCVYTFNFKEKIFFYCSHNYSDVIVYKF